MHERETELRHLGDNLPDGVIYQVVRRLDGSNYFPYISGGLERTFGVSPAEAMRDADMVYRLIVAEDLLRMRAAADESIRTLTPFEIECRLHAVDGGERWLTLRARPSRLPDGATLWDAVALDITERKRAEEALHEREVELRALGDDLRRSEARYRRLFERSFVGIFRTRPDGILLECNDAFARILGYRSAVEARGRSVLDHYATLADRHRVVGRISAGEDVHEVELVARRCDGSLVPVAMSARRIIDQDGPMHEGVLMDLTDHKRAEEAAALRSVTELANAAAHEINNPLAVIIGQLELIQRADGNVADRLERAREAAARIGAIVSHMLRITRLAPSTAWPAGLPRILDLAQSAGSGAPDSSSG